MKSVIWYLLASAALLTRRCAALSQPSPSPRLQNVVDVPPFAGVGVTSILPVPSTIDEYYVGTKRGKVKLIKMPGGAHQAVSIDAIEDENGRQLKPYPAFSMMSVHNGEEGDNHGLLTGGGDRYVTVWRKTNEEEWEVLEQLGPHTGWVKDLASASVDGKRFVFSIGCNCIEVWAADGGRYDHTHKLQIESSVESGSTLSSDLLCLATYSELGASYLLAGGVDGRIHRWEIKGNTFRNVGAISAHSGRVNEIKVCHRMKVMVSAGNDGCIQCRAMGNSQPLAGKVSSLRLGEEDAQTKITSLCLVNEEGRKVVVAAGTSSGKIALAEIICEGNTIQASWLKDRALVGSYGGGEGGAAIHALCSRGQMILVGHSFGLSAWIVPII